MGPQGKDLPFELEGLAFTGPAKGRLVREGGVQRIYWLKKGGADLPTVKEPSGFSCFFRVN